MPSIWKKNILKVPVAIMTKLENMEAENVTCGVVKRIPINDIVAGDYAHLGIEGKEDKITIQKRVEPPPQIGRWSRTNVEGKEVKRKDLPKYTKTFAIESPNWGDSYYGTHTVYMDREVYPVDFISPKHAELLVELVDADDTHVLIRFRIDVILDTKSQDFEKDLFYLLNVLQENVGVIDVFPSDATVDEYIETVRVDWEIFPSGTREEDLDRLLRHAHTDEERGLIRERFSVLQKMKPTNWIQGTSGFQRYFGAQFSDDLVVFENMRYGNALYVMYQDWRTLSQKSRLELLAGPSEGFERILHTPGWIAQLKLVVNDKLGRRREY